MVSDQFQAVQTRIADAAYRVGRDPKDIRLICVTKSVSLDGMREVLTAGATNLGESRLQEARPKILELGRKAVHWHMIGHLQRNKAKAVLELFDWVHSVDNKELALALDRHAESLSKRPSVLIEVNVSGEAGKQGISVEELPALVDEIRKLRRLKLEGLMTMAPLSENPENSRSIFKRLKQLAKQFELKELSMGMSQDFEVAVEEGATFVRVGSAIFK